MATPKSWTAHDVQMGKLTIVRRGSTLQIERRYLFEDDTGTVLTDVAGGRLLDEIDWASIPANVQAALLDIDQWTYDQILAREGMT